MIGREHEPAPLDAELRRTLDDRGRDVRVVGDLAGPAMRRAASRARHRAVATGVAAVTVLALGVPAGWSALSRTGTTPLPAGTTTSGAQGPRPTLETGRPAPSTTPPRRTPSPTTAPPSPAVGPTRTSTGAPDAATLVPAGGPVTGTTSAAYLVDGVFHSGDARITLPRALDRPARVAALGSGVLVADLKPGGGARLSFVDAEGTLGWRYDTASTDVITDAEHVRALYVEPSGRPVVVDADGRRTPVTGSPSSRPGAGLPEQAPPAPVALTATAAYLTLGEQTSTVRYDLGRPEVREVPGVVVAVDRATEHGVVVDPSLQPGQRGYGCQRLMDLPTGRVVWTLCGPLRFDAFSADGQYLLGAGFSDGMPASLLNGPDGRPRYRSFVVARVSDGAVVLQGGGVGTGPTPSAGDAVMSADGTLTTQTTDRTGRRTLERCGLDGGCEVVGAAAPPWDPDVPESDGPYLLGQP